MSELFPNIPQIKYEGPNSKSKMAFRHYNPEEQIMGKPMREYMKFAISYWHTMTAGGKDIFGDETADKSFGADEDMQIAYNRVDACFELMEKLSIDYFCFHAFCSKWNW